MKSAKSPALAECYNVSFGLSLTCTRSHSAILFWVS